MAYGVGPQLFQLKKQQLSSSITLATAMFLITHLFHQMAEYMFVFFALYT